MPTNCNKKKKINIPKKYITSVPKVTKKSFEQVLVIAPPMVTEVKLLMLIGIADMMSGD